MFEQRIAAWDRTEMGATFSSGMAAVLMSVLTLTKPGDIVLSTSPVDGGEAAAFDGVDRFEVFRLAVSLGGTESFLEHPASMTHANVL